MTCNFLSCKGYLCIFFPRMLNLQAIKFVNILSSTANATLHLILNNSLTVGEIRSKFGREVAMPFAKVTPDGQ